MDWRLAGQAHSVIMEFIVDGQPVVPDADTIKFTAWDHEGNVIQKYNFTQPEDAIPTQMEIVMSLEMGDLTTDKLWEARYVRADFYYKNKPYSVKTSYRLHHMIPLSIDEQFVRGLFGADYDEMPDGDIDLISAYIQVASVVGETLPNAMRLTNYVGMAANEAVALQAAINICVSLQGRMLKSEKVDNAAFQRGDLDFVRLQADLEGRLNGKLNLIAETITGVAVVASTPTLFVLSTQTDRITGTEPV